MRISTKALLDQIIKNEVKDIPNAKSILQDNILGENKKENFTKKNVEQLINQLLKDISSGAKTKENTLENLKQSDIPKLMKNTMGELKTLLILVKNNKMLIKFAPVLEKLFLNIDQIKPETFKHDLSKTGTLMESKLSSIKTQNMPLELKEVLVSLKSSLLKQIPREKLRVEIVEIILNDKNIEKEPMKVAKELLKKLKISIKILEDLKTDKNSPKNTAKSPNELKIDKSTSGDLSKSLNTLKTNKIDTKNSTNLVKELNANRVNIGNSTSIAHIANALKTNKIDTKQLITLFKKLDNVITKNIPVKDENIKNILKEVKSTLEEPIRQNTQHIKVIDKILTAKEADSIFLKDIKTLVSEIKQSREISKPIIKVLARLDELVDHSKLLDSKIKNSNKKDTSSKVQEEVKKITIEIKKSLIELKDVIKTPQTETLTESKTKEITQIVEQVLKMPEFFSKKLDKATIYEKLQQAVNLIKNELVKTDIKKPIQVEVAKLTNRLETVIKEHIVTKQIVPNQKLLTNTSIKQEITNDIKSTLLSIKHELGVQITPATREISLHVDRLINQIEYFQLVSLGI